MSTSTEGRWTLCFLCLESASQVQRSILAHDISRYGDDVLIVVDVPINVVNHR